MDNKLSYENHEVYMRAIKSIISSSSLDEETAYKLFYYAHPPIVNGVFSTDIINGSLLYIKKYIGLASFDHKTFKSNRKLSLFIKDYDATFIFDTRCIIIKNFDKPISDIVFSHHLKETNISDASYKECAENLDLLMDGIASILVWHYKHANIDKRDKTG